jgi:hypothetical protein
MYGQKERQKHQKNRAKSKAPQLSSVTVSYAHPNIARLTFYFPNTRRVATLRSKCNGATPSIGESRQIEPWIDASISFHHRHATSYSSANGDAAAKYSTAAKSINTSMTTSPSTDANLCERTG